MTGGERCRSTRINGEERAEKGAEPPDKRRITSRERCRSARINGEQSVGVKIEIIPSKSFAHRAMICAALSETKSEVKCDFFSKDIEATRNCVDVLKNGGTLLKCGESGSTLRFLLPVFAALGRKGIFVPEGRLIKRPLSPLYEELESHGCSLSPKGESPIVIEGKLVPGIFRLPGNISSQYISGLMMALPLLEGKSRIDIEGELESAAYVDITLKVLAEYDIVWIKKVTSKGVSYEIPYRQKYAGPAEFCVEGDWSAAAFWLCAGAVGSTSVTVSGLNLQSLQGDRQIVEILKTFGAEVHEGENSVTVYPSKLYGAEVDLAPIPDLGPVVALLGCAAYGKTRIINAERLRLKESDRLSAIAENLKTLGGKVKEKKDGLVIKGLSGAKFVGGEVSSFNDHRIAMMEAVASLFSYSRVIIDGKEAADKSYPDFFKIMREVGLGGNIG